jgi:hypothetical protein
MNQETNPLRHFSPEVIAEVYQTWRVAVEHQLLDDQPSRMLVNAELFPFSPRNEAGLVSCCPIGLALALQYRHMGSPDVDSQADRIFSEPIPSWDAAARKLFLLREGRYPTRPLDSETMAYYQIDIGDFMVEIDAGDQREVLDLLDCLSEEGNRVSR